MIEVESYGLCETCKGHCSHSLQQMLIQWLRINCYVNVRAQSEIHSKCICSVPRELLILEIVERDHIEYVHELKLVIGFMFDSSWSNLSDIRSLYECNNFLIFLTHDTLNRIGPDNQISNTLNRIQLFPLTNFTETLEYLSSLLNGFRDGVNHETKISKPRQKQLFADTRKNILANQLLQINRLSEKLVLGLLEVFDTPNQLISALKYPNDFENTQILVSGKSRRIGPTITNLMCKMYSLDTKKTDLVYEK